MKLLYKRTKTKCMTPTFVQPVIITMERCIILNNLAVDLLQAGFLEEACDVLKVAIEVILAHDQQKLGSCTTGFGVRRFLFPCACVFRRIFLGFFRSEHKTEDDRKERCSPLRFQPFKSWQE